MLILIGGVLGLPFGALLKSNWERKVRGGLMPWVPFGSGNVWPILAGVVLVKIPLVAFLFFGPPVFVLTYFDLLPLYGKNYQVFFLVYLVSISVGKALRYTWWRFHFRGQLV
ncbi:MAG: hypothetical protein V4447_01625 [Pseudomonadota bacterium]